MNRQLHSSHSPGRHPLPIPPATEPRAGAFPAAASLWSRPQVSPQPAILLVDDDTDLLKALQSTLRLNGFEVEACDNPSAAERAIDQAPRVDLLVTDMQMPEASGLTLAEHLAKSHPSLPVMIISGSTLSRAELQAIERRGWYFLSKPLDVMQLLTALYGLLGSTENARNTAGFSPLSFLPESALAQPHASRSEKVQSYTSNRVPSKGNVLLIGDDPMLQRSRQLLLEHAGYHTFEVNSTHVSEYVDPASFQLALLCRSVSPSDAVKIARSLHAGNPHLPILRFATLGESGSGQFAASVNNVSSPAFLITEVERLVTQHR